MALDPRTWFQTSRAYRTVARIPTNETPMAALKRVDRRAWMEAHRRFEADCAEQYLREHAERDGNSRTLTIEEFTVFRAAGGRTYR